VRGSVEGVAIRWPGRSLEVAIPVVMARARLPLRWSWLARLATCVAVAVVGVCALPALAGADVPLLTPELLDQAEANADNDDAARAAFERWRLTDGPTAERDDSRDAYGDLNTQGARDLLLSEFGGALEAASAPPLDVPAGWQVLKHVGEHGAVLVSPTGEHRYVDSPVPLVVTSANGERSPLDLELEGDADGWVPKNAAADVSLPAQLSDGLAVGDSGVKLFVPGSAGADGSKVPGQDAVIYSDAVAGADADFAAAPTAGGLETFIQVRSPAAAESSELRLDLPVGASLVQDPVSRTIAVVRDGRAFLMVLPPTGVDAQGEPVEVTMTVTGDSITLHYPHRDKDLAYPLAIDPAIIETSVATDTWAWGVTDSTFTASTSCRPDLAGNSCAGGANGLWMYKANGTQSGRNFGQWVYSVPHSTGGDITTARIASFQTLNQHAEGYGDSAQSPMLINGILNTTSGQWSASWSTPVWVSGGYHANAGPQLQVSGDPNSAANAGAKVAIVALDHPAAGTRWASSYAFFGGASVAIIDPDGASVDPIASPGLWFGANSQYLIHTVAHDRGLGVYSYTLFRDLVDPAHVYQNYSSSPPNKDVCDSLAAHPCPQDPPPHDMKLDPWDPRLPEGIDHMTMCAYDLVVNVPAQCANFDVKIDRTPPVLDALAGSLKKAADRGTVLTKDAYTLTVDAHDGAVVNGGPTQSGVVRVEYWVDGVLKASNGATVNGAFTCVATQCPTHPDVNSFVYQPADYAATGPTHTVVAKVYDRANNNPLVLPAVTVTAYLPPSPTPVGLGFEDWWTYEQHDTGAGGSYYVNLTSGNGVWTATPVANPGRGLSSFARLTYNAQEANAPGVTYNQAGAQFSLQASGVTRLNEPLDLSHAPPGSGPRQVVLRDGDGTQHIFGNQAGGDAGWAAPPGVHLYLRKFAASGDKTWAMTRPDGVTYFFDAAGWATSVTDRNANTLSFEYEPWPAGSTPQCGVAPGGCTQRVKRIRDATGRFVTFAYGTGGSATGKVIDIVDHAGVATHLNYVAQGGVDVLESMVEASGTADARGTHFVYQTNANQPRLTEVDDPRTDNAGKTTIAYSGTAPTSTVNSVTDRRGHAVGYEFATASCDDGGGAASYTRVRATDAKSHVTEYLTDAFGRLHCQTSPRGFLTTQRWTLHNNVGQRVEASGTPEAATSVWGWNNVDDDHEATLGSFTDPEGNKTSYSYQRGNGGSTAAIDDDGAFVQDVASVLSPRGNQAASGEQDKYTTRFTRDARGNVLTRASPGNVGGGGSELYTATYTYDAATGVRLTADDESHNTTSYSCFDANGQPRIKTDPRGKKWLYEFDAVANTLAVSDPRVANSATCSTSRPSTYTQTTTYDRLNRKLTELTPKDSATGASVTRSWGYDANDNQTSYTDGNGKQRIWEYTNTDQASKQTTPPVAHHGDATAAAEVTDYTYDDANNLSCEKRPLSAVDAGHATCYAYDEADEKVAEIQRAASSDDSAANLYTTYSYDRRGNVNGVADPKHNDAAATVTAAVANATADATRRYRYSYDLADRRTIQIEDPAGLNLRTRYVYDADDNLVRQDHPRAFDSNDDGIGDTATPRSGYADTFTFDKRDLLVARADALARTTTMDRRGDGRVVKSVTPRGQETTANPDDLATQLSYWETGELKSRSLPRVANQYGPSDWKVQYTINDVGDPVVVTDARGNAITNTFYDTGELKSTTRPSWWTFDPGSGGPMIRERTNQDPPTSDPAEGKVPNAKDAVGDLGNVSGAAMPDVMPRAAATVIRYDDEMRPIEVTNGPGTAAGLTATQRSPYSQRLSFDDLGRLTTRSIPLDDAQRVELHTTYDRDGNARAVSDGIDANQTIYAYDAFDRRTAMTEPGAQGGDRTTSYDLDANGNIDLEHTPISGQDVDRSFDAVDRLTMQRDPLSTSPQTKRTYRFDADGNVTRETDPRANVTTTDPYYQANQFTQYFYDGAGELTKTRLPSTTGQTASDDRDWDYEYDADGNQTKATSPGSKSSSGDSSISRRVVQRSYDGRGLLWTETTGAGAGATERTQITEYDANGNLRRSIDPAGVQPDRTPTWPFASANFDGAIGTASDLDHYATVHEYNDDDLLTKIDLPWGSGDGLPTDSARKRWRQEFTYDVPGDATRPYRGWVRRIRAPYDAVDTSAAVNEQRYEYYDNGWIKQSRDADLVGGAADYKQTVLYKYLTNGLQSEWSSRNEPTDTDPSRKIQRDYWPSRQLKTRQASRYSGGVLQDYRAYGYEYDKNGSLTKITDHQPPRGDNSTPTVDQCAVANQPSGCPIRDTVLAYDGSQRPLSVDEQWGGGRDTRYFYLPDGQTRRVDADGTLSGGTYTGGKISNDSYDERGRDLTSTIDQPGGPTRTTTRSFWPSEQVRHLDRANGSSQDLYYAADAKATQRVDESTTVDYGYGDANRNRTADERGAYAYNARRQLVGWTRAASATRPARDVAYIVNGAGAVSKKIDHYAQHLPTATADTTITTTNTYRGDRLESAVVAATGQPTKTADYDYDTLFGSMTTVDDGDELTRYKYDAFERLTRSFSSKDTSNNDTVICHDGLDRRDRRVVLAHEQTAFAGSGSIERLACSVTPSNATAYDYSYVGTSEALSREHTANELRFYDYSGSGSRLGQATSTTDTSTKAFRPYEADANGDVVALLPSTHTAPAASDRYDYDPYGELERRDFSAGTPSTAEGQLSADAKGNPFRFEGFYYDQPVRTYDMQARHYRPDIGRFLTQDRFEDAGSDIALQGDPLTNNRYAFLAGDPVGNVESDGHIPGAGSGCVPRCGDNAGNNITTVGGVIADNPNVSAPSGSVAAATPLRNPAAPALVLHSILGTFTFVPQHHVESQSSSTLERVVGRAFKPIGCASKQITAFLNHAQAACSDQESAQNLEQGTKAAAQFWFGDPTNPVDLAMLLPVGKLAKLGKLGLFARRAAKAGRVAGDAEGFIGPVRESSDAIANGHAFGKHVIQQGEFPGITTSDQFAREIEGVVSNPTASKPLLRGRSAYYDEPSNTLVIRDPRSPDGGTAFRPSAGRRYYDGLR
jgi:RHS repeat-associated protein